MTQKPVIAYKLNHRTLMIMVLQFESVEEAAEKLGTTKTRIWTAISRRNKTAGYYWKYQTNEENKTHKS